jgi:hypothetical protein
MDDFEKELEDLEATMRSDRTEHQLREAWRRRFEESEFWKEHERVHNEEGTAAKLEVWEAPVPVQQPVVPNEPARLVRMVPVGGCACQPHMALMQIEGERITAGIPVSETQTYGRLQEGTAQYGAQQGTPQNEYNSPPGQVKDLYR